ncbi:MAG: acyl carrier protein [Desulfobacterales bacterium]
MPDEEQIRQTALDIIAGIAPEVDITQVDPEARLRNQFDFDSVDFMNFAVALQERLKVVIPEEDYPRLATLKSCTAYFISKLHP